MWELNVNIRRTIRKGKSVLTHYKPKNFGHRNVLGVLKHVPSYFQ